MLKEQKGITLVALVITIIVLLILAGVTISLVLGDNGILNHAKTGGNSYQKAANNEVTMLNDVSTEIDNIVNGI